MKKMILQLCALGLLIALGQSLKCYECRFGIMSLCYTTEIDCAVGEECFHSTIDAGALQLSMKGCMLAAECNKSITLDKYTTLKKDCCKQDLCNAAPGLAGFSGLGLGLATITALLITQVLV